MALLLIVMFSSPSPAFAMRHYPIAEGEWSEIVTKGRKNILEKASIILECISSGKTCRTLRDKSELTSRNSSCVLSFSPANVHLEACISASDIARPVNR
jgi:hypothetical protein